MGLEGRSHTHSIDTILAKLNAGEITPGNKISEVELKTATGHIIIGRLNDTNRTLSYTHNGMAVEAEIRPDGSLGYFTVTDPVTGISTSDNSTFQTQREILEQWARSRQN